ncbi:MAG: cytochrome c peroxidase [Betaproteobacteria bacterium]
MAATALILVIANPAAAAGDTWSPAELAVLASMRLNQLPPVTRDASNAYEADPAAAALGRRLFFDTRFSRNQAVSCATCHDPDRQFQDGRPQGQALGITARRTMPVAGAGYGPWLFWDGRKDSLWSQALGPMEDAREHGGNRLRHAHLMQAHYRVEYEKVFGAMPDISGLPPDAGPLGTPLEKTAWNVLAPADQQRVSRIFANIGKAIAAFEKTLRHGESRFDRYVEAVLRGAGPASPLSAPEVNGLRTFIAKGQCVSCHNGPLFTDHFFHSTRVPPLDPVKPDPGRAAGAVMVQEDPFNCLGPFSDAGPAQCPELRFMVIHDPALRRAFKTPSLRGVALRPPYMHAGQFATLTEVIRHYVKAPETVIVATRSGHSHGLGSELNPLTLSEQEIEELVAFLGTLSGSVIEDVKR